ncbi:uncharacterized protein FTJAE_6964 [Fusarium tjaetaba]|uniref:F-box domain-containing protein n=1 Tax=Fusarium tjaetaba TaxID=1567544 RepID=A0A8H5VTG0_9HYPO|nr:uncharacterized protein FTJAE_6964 [Fusarium tjaetaba]KAF5633813.1 hypothetical protein FTJAE_6964 [Fusarium tjaetaba]
MLMQWLSQLFCRQTRQYPDSSISPAIEVPLETTVQGTHGIVQICTSTTDTVPELDIHDIADELNDEDWNMSIVQEVIDRSVSNELGKTREVAEQDSRLLNLPDEILLIIIRILYEGSDKRSLFAFFVLRQVSQKFRGLMRDNMFLSHVFSDSGCCEWCSGGFRGKWTRIKPSTYSLHCFEEKDGTDLQDVSTRV